MDAKPPEPRDRFEELKQHIATALSESLRDLLPQLAEDLEAAGERTAYHRDRQAIFTAAAMLRIDADTRTRRAREAIIDRAERVRDALVAGTADRTDLRLLEDDELDGQILVADLAAQLRQAAGPAYPSFDRRAATVCGRDWPNDDLNPVGARALAWSAYAGVRDVVQTAAARASVRASLRARLPALLAALVVKTDAWLAKEGVGPFQEPPAEAVPPAVIAVAPPEDPARLTRDDSAARDAAASVDAGSARPAAAPSETGGGSASTDPAAPSSDPGRTGAPARGGSAPLPEHDRRQSDRDPGPQLGTSEQAEDRTPARDAVPETTADAAEPRASQAAAVAMHSAETLASSPFSGHTAPVRLSVLPTLQPVVEIERDAVAFAHTIDVVPYSRDARRAFFGNVRGRVAEAGGTPAQLATVDVVAAMFDYVVDDRRLPEAAKPLMWRMQQPAVALSLLDPGYLADDPRSLRRLVENFGAISTAFGDEVVRGNELYKRLETVVRAVEIVASVLQTRSAVMSRQVEQEYHRASRSVTQLIDRVINERNQLEAAPGRRNRRDYGRRPGREQEREVTERLTRMLADRMGRHLVPDSVREFLQNVWLRHLRTALLRDGEESAEFKLALQVVDDLLWSLDGGAKRQSRRELAQRIPPLIRLLTHGLREIGAKDEEFKSFFDELFLVHLRKMQPAGRGSTTTRLEDSRSTTTRSSATGRNTGFGAQVAEAVDVPVLDMPLPEPEPGTTRAARGEASVGPDSRTGDPARNIAGQSAKPDVPARPAPAVAADSGPDSPEKKLLEVLNSLDLQDLPAHPEFADLTPAEVLQQLTRGDWLQLASRSGELGFAKVAWINSRRTVVLMVRSMDRRALSMRFGDLRDRLQQGTARLVKSSRPGP